MNKFKCGDWVHIYQAAQGKVFRTTTWIEEVDGPIVLIHLLVNLCPIHYKQCRALKRKPKTEHTDLWTGRRWKRIS